MEVPISVVMITKNEASRVEEALRSVQGWAGEIIVVDDESIDQTKEIAARFTDRVLAHKMDFEGRHRNWAYQQASFDWVLSLDADERLSPQLREEIKDVLSKNPKHTGFMIPRKNFIGNRWLKYGGQYPAAQLKLFRKDKFKWEEASLEPRAFLEGECGPLANPIFHYTYRDFEDFLRKVNVQTTQEARKWIMIYRENPPRAGRKMNLSAALWRMFDRFFQAFFIKAGFNDHLPGFMAAVFGSLYQILVYAKYWEMKKKL